jgi:hypothetical protein
MTEQMCACSQVQSEEQGPSSIGILNDCFEIRVFDHLVSFTVAGDFAVPAAPLTAILPACVPSMPPANALIFAAEHPIRAGPFSPAASRAQLMVFLT